MPGNVLWIQLPHGVRMWVRVDADGPIDMMERMKERLADLKPLWKEAAAVMRQSFAENFRVGGRPQKWKELSKGTVISKAVLGLRDGFPYATMRGRRRIRRLAQMRGGRLVRSLANILIASGDYRDSFVQKGHRGHVSRISEDGFEEGSADRKTAFHEEGTKPYTIRPKRAKSLRFFSATGGAVFAKKVEHPGLPARPVALIQDEDIEKIGQMAEEHLDGRSRPGA